MFPSKVIAICSLLALPITASSSPITPRNPDLPKTPDVIYDFTWFHAQSTHDSPNSQYGFFVESENNHGISERNVKTKCVKMREDTKFDIQAVQGHCDDPTVWFSLEPKKNGGGWALTVVNKWELYIMGKSLEYADTATYYFSQSQVKSNGPNRHYQYEHLESPDFFKAAAKSELVKTTPEEL